MLNSSVLIEKLKAYPCYLFLGQKYLKYGNIVDPFLNSIKKQYRITTQSEEQLKYNLIFEAAKDEKNEDVLTWMQNKSNRISKPEWLTHLANIPWNGVFTSAIDNVIIRSFQNNWRDVQPVYSVETYPKDIRSKSKMHINFLFGSINQEKVGERPPLSEIELITYKLNSLKMLSRINKEFLTPFGTFIIDGYDPMNDWLKLEDMFAIIDSLDDGQVYFFGMDDELLKNPLIKHLKDKKKLITSSESLYNILLNDNLDFNIDDFIFEEYSNKKLVNINNKVNAIPKELYNDISKFAIVLDDTILLPKNDSLNENEIQEMFKEFLRKSSISPIWDAYKYGFNILRLYEREISAAINDSLKDNKHYYSSPIILHGQTGTGKTVSLAAVAYEYKLKNYPVLFITQDASNISFNIIDDFCKWAEDKGADKTIIFWDDTVYNKEIDEYLDLNNYLVSKGRKVVVIGSSYKLKGEILKLPNVRFIEAPIELADSEKDSVIKVFNKFSGRQESLELIWDDSYDNSFLVALYRLLPGSKFAIRQGVLSEVDSHEITMAELLKIKPSKSITAMEEALLKAGYNLTNTNLEIKDFKTNFNSISDIVSLVGQFGEGIPLELLLRVLEGEFSLEVAKIITSIDFFHTIHTSNGNLKVYPRHKLEAQIVSQSKLSVDNQINLIKEIISNIKVGDFRYQDELNFIIELLKSIGPNNEEQAFKFKNYYLDISIAISRLRTEHGIYNYRTIIQETTYLREFIKNTDKFDKCEKLIYLEEASQLLKKEVDSLEGVHSKSKALGTLLIELSSNLGTQLRYKIELKYSKNQIYKDFAELNIYLKKAQIFASDNYYALDILAWTSEIMIESNEIFTVEERTDILANLFSTFEKAQMENPDLVNREDFNIRLFSISKLAGFSKINKETFNRLIELGSASGIYLTAREKIASLNLNKPLNKNEIIICNKTIAYLNSYSKYTSNDEKCLYLLLKLFWCSINRSPLFYNEKQLLFFKKDEWEYLNKLLDKIILLNSNNTTPQIKYLKAITLFHLGDLRGCNEIFSEIRDNYYIGPRRIMISYLVSTNEGKALKYSGILDSLNDNKALFYIAELRKHIPYFNRNFIAKSPELKNTYTDLTLGFNFLGIQIASHLSKGEER